jgi:hypothetical protein
MKITLNKETSTIILLKISSKIHFQLQFPKMQLCLYDFCEISSLFPEFPEKIARIPTIPAISMVRSGTVAEFVLRYWLLTFNRNINGSVKAFNINYNLIRIYFEQK